MAKGLLDDVRKLYEDRGLDALWKWAMSPKGAHSKAKRFGALAHFAGNRKGKPGNGDPDWSKIQNKYRERRDHFEEVYEDRQEDKAEKWPATLVVAELLYHYPGPHVHLASPERDKLISIFVIAQNLGIRVGEFHEASAGLLDTIEDVHAKCVSWHYRSSANPSVPRCFEDHADGCAGDLNDADGGSDKEYAFFIELKRRYA